MDDETLPAISDKRQIPVKSVLSCGHWGYTLMSRLEYTEWVARGLPLHIKTGEPRPCDKCNSLDK